MTTTQKDILAYVEELAKAKSADGQGPLAMMADGGIDFEAEEDRVLELITEVGDMMLLGTMEKMGGFDAFKEMNSVRVTLGTVWMTGVITGLRAAAAEQEAVKA